MHGYFVRLALLLPVLQYQDFYDKTGLSQNTKNARRESKLATVVFLGYQKDLVFMLILQRPVENFACG